MLLGIRCLWEEILAARHRRFAYRAGTEDIVSGSARAAFTEAERLGYIDLRLDYLNGEARVVDRVEPRCRVVALIEA